MKINCTQVVIQISVGLLLALATLMPAESLGKDWLIEPRSFKAEIRQDKPSQRLVLSNGIASRVFYLGHDSVSTLKIINETDQRNLLRAIRPELELTLNGKDYLVGGLAGQPNHAFLKGRLNVLLHGAP